MGGKVVLFRNYNIIRKDMIFAIIAYSLCVIYSIFISKESDYNHLKNGLIILLLFYSQLILITVNSVYINKSKTIYSKDIVQYKNSELSLRFIIFLITNLNLDRVGLRMTLGNRLAVIAIGIVSSGIIFLYQYTIRKESSILVRSRKIDKQKLEGISLLGMILYTYSIYIGRYAELDTLALKLIAFYIAIMVIFKKLKEFYVDLRKKRLLFIMVSLGVGFLINFIGAIVFIYVGEENIVDFYSIKDIMIIVGIICALPLLKVYNNVN